jgi:hypothetical protein
MNKEDADAKIVLLVAMGALAPGNVTTYYDTVDDAPKLTFEYTHPSGAGGTTSIPMQHTGENLSSLASNLPVLTGSDRLAVLAILLAPSAPSAPSL